MPRISGFDLIRARLEEGILRGVHLSSNLDMRVKIAVGREGVEILGAREVECAI